MSGERPGHPGGGIIQKRAILGILVAALAFWAPLPFASVEVEFKAVLLGGGALAGGLAALLLPRFAVPAAAWLLVALAALGVAQSVPLPVSLVDDLSARRVELAAAGAQVLGGAAPARLAVSFNPEATQVVSIQLCALAALWAAVASCSLSRSARRWPLTALLLAGLFQAGYGLSQLAAGEARIWRRAVEATDPGRLRGTFINPDHAAFFLNLTLAVAFAWFCWSLRRSRGAALSVRLLWLGPPAVVWSALLLAAALTGSRAGLLALAVVTIGQGLLAAAVVVRPRRRFGKTAAVGVALAALALLVVMVIAFDRTLDRAANTSLYELQTEQRLAVYRAASGLVREAPLLGSGLGTFRDVFPRAQPPGVGGSWLHAHSDLLELLLTAGAVGVTLGVLAVVVLLRQLRRVLCFGPGSEDRAAALAGCGGALAAIVHSAFDYGLTMPANAVALVVVLAAATTRAPAAAQRSQDELAG